MITADEAREILNARREPIEKSEPFLRVTSELDRIIRSAVERCATEVPIDDDDFARYAKGLPRGYDGEKPEIFWFKHMITFLRNNGFELVEDRAPDGFPRHGHYLIRWG